MKNDLNKTFGEIFNDDITAFREQLLDIQQHQADRKDSEKWVRRLRFLDISDVPKLGPYRKKTNDKPQQIIPITRRKDDDGEARYIAVSWRWIGRHASTPHGCSLHTTFDYWIRRPGEQPCKSGFPDWYMERVIRFAQSVSITNIWIDTECIYQRTGDPLEDKQLGVQIMDVVYGESAASVGLLTTGMTHQEEVESLATILDKLIFVDAKDKEHPKLKDEVDIPELQLIILRVLSDPRWSRGWIFQEDHLASAVMTLLIPHSKEIEKSDAYDFGDIPGELQVNLADFRQAVTMFCLACPGDEERWPLSEILGKAKQYNIWNKKVHSVTPNVQGRHPVRLWSESSNSHNVGAKLNTKSSYSNVSHYPTTTISVLDDVCSRSLEQEQDRLAIVANALGFSTRLNISDDSPLLASGKYSLSTALLALILLNGEILRNDHDMSEAIMQHTLRSYLKEVEYKFHAPNFRFEQSFIDHCRLRSPKMTSGGIETKGFLFELLSEEEAAGLAPQLNPLRFNDQDRDKLYQLSRKPHAHTIHKGQKLSTLAREAIFIFIEKLEKAWPASRLAAFLKIHVELDLHPPPPEKADLATKYVLDMMSAFYQALRDDCELRLGRRISDNGDFEPTAVFIMPQPEGWQSGLAAAGGDVEPTFVFTSWNEGDGIYDRERLASLEVSLFDEHGLRRNGIGEGGKCFLRSHGWVNGIWDVRGQTMKRYVFPLEGITEHPGENKGRKRRRGNNDVGRAAEGKMVVL